MAAFAAAINEAPANQFVHQFPELPWHSLMVSRDTKSVSITMFSLRCRPVHAAHPEMRRVPWTRDERNQPGDVRW